MACGCKRLIDKLENDGKIVTKKQSKLSKILTAPLIILLILIMMPIFTLYLIYRVFVKDTTIIIPKKLLKYFR